MTREEVIAEIQNLEGDAQTFREIRDVLQRRFSELSESPRFKDFVEWPATAVVWNGTAMALSRCEGLLEEHRRILGEFEEPDNIVQLVRS